MPARPNQPFVYPQEIAAELHEEFGYSAIDADQLVERYIAGDLDPAVGTALAALQLNPRT